MKIPSVALVGLPNVGKSTVFNRLVGKKISIIEDTPGVTRDRIYGDVIYKNYKFHLIPPHFLEKSPCYFYLHEQKLYCFQPDMQQAHITVHNPYML